MYDHAKNLEERITDLEILYLNEADEGTKSRLLSRINGARGELAIYRKSVPVAKVRTFPLEDILVGTILLILVTCVIMR